VTMKRSILPLIAALSLLAAVPAQAAADLKTEFIAPANLVNGEATGGPAMTLGIRVTNTSTTESSPAVRLSIFKYDHTCSGYPKNQPTVANSSSTYATVDALAPGQTKEVSFVDTNTTVPANTASMTICYKTGLNKSDGGYYSDSNSLNHAASKAIKYVPGAAATQSPLALTVSNVTASPTSCGPGSSWVEAVVNSTQVIQGLVLLEGTGINPVEKPVDLQIGNNTIRVNVNWPSSGTYPVTFRAKAPRTGTSVQASGQASLNIAKCKGTISILAPAAAETVGAGSAYTVRWSTANVPADDQLTIRIYDGAAWREVATDTPNDGNQQVTMPSGNATNARVQMFARKVSAQAYSKDFTLRSGGTGGGTGTGTASMTVTQPAGGESVAAGQTVYVRWTSSGTVGDQVRLRLFRGTAYLRDLTQNTSNDGNEPVTIPADTAAMTDAKINVVSSLNVNAMSNAFTIQAAGGTGTGGGTATGTISVTAPSAGTQLLAGQTANVTWTSTGSNGSNVRIRISLGGGAWKDLKTSVANDGSEQVTLPDVYRHSDQTGELISTTQAKIEVASTSATVRGESGSFSIKVPSVNFTSHLYNRITTDCAMCHPIATKSDGTPVTYNDSQNADMINPQKARAQDDSFSSVNELNAPVIPFSTAVTAAEMLSRFKSVKAVSPVYSNARNKIYVVPNNAENSGLHHKAQDSDSQIFRNNATIDNVSMKIRDWITLWIKQGAN
jgi:hypothetical protein